MSHRLLDTPRFAKGKQSWNYEAHFELSAERPAGSNMVKVLREVVRVRIVRASHVFQSSAVLDVYDPAGRVWNELARLFPADAAVCQPKPEPGAPNRERVSYVHSAERLDRDAFVEDAETLLALGEIVLSGNGSARLPDAAVRILGAPVVTDDESPEWGRH